jgi:hypothetical protein
MLLGMGWHIVGPYLHAIQQVRFFIGHQCRVFKFLYLSVPEPAGDAEVFAGGFDEVSGGE